MKKSIIFWVITAAFFVFYFGVLRFIWNSWVPFNAITDILALFILVIVNIPASLISANWLYRNMKEA